jgi:hypothetical protein
MKRNSRRLSSWIVVAVIALSVGMIGASEQLPPEGPLALLYAQIHALFVEAGLLAAESNDQQEQIDQLTGTLCGLSVLTGNPAPPELCEVVVTEICRCQLEVADCDCDPGPFFDLESCESGYFPSPYPTPEPGGGDPPPKCTLFKGCRGTFTRTAAGDEASAKVEAECSGGNPGDDCPAECAWGCAAGSSVCLGGCHFGGGC